VVSQCHQMGAPPPDHWGHSPEIETRWITVGPGPLLSPGPQWRRGPCSLPTAAIGISWCFNVNRWRGRKWPTHILGDPPGIENRGCHFCAPGPSCPRPLGKAPAPPLAVHSEAVDGVQVLHPEVHLPLRAVPAGGGRPMAERRGGQSPVIHPWA